MLNRDMQCLSSNAPCRLCIILTLLATLFLLQQCDHSSSDNGTSSSTSTPTTTSNDPDSNSSERPINRTEEAEKRPRTLKNKRTFTLTDAYTIGPVKQDADQLRAWLQVPLETRQQTVHEIFVDAGNLTYDMTKDPQTGNRFLYIAIVNPTGSYEVVVKSRVTRRSVREPYKSGTPQDQTKRYLRETPEVPVNNKMKHLALEKGATGHDRESMHKIYEFVVNHSTSDNVHPDKDQLSGSEDLDVEFSLEQQEGGCANVHALYMSLARSVNIPTRLVTGSYLPSDLDGTDQGVSDHCWVETYLDGEGWFPVDVPFANHRPELHNFYFGGLDARRIVFSRGHGINLVPASNNPVHDFINGHIEVDGELYNQWDRKLTFRELQ